MKIIVAICCFCLVTFSGYSQYSLVYDNNDYIPPNLLNNPNDSIKIKSFVTGTCGLGYNFITSTKPVNDSENLIVWFNEAYYINRFQFNLKIGVFSSYDSLIKDSKEHQDIAEPKILVGYYIPIFGKGSYFNDAIRLQFGEYSDINLDAGRSHSVNHYELIYGGNFTDPKSDIIGIGQYSLIYTPTSGFQYNYWGYQTLIKLKSQKVIQGIEIYYGITRNNYKGVDKWYEFDVGLVTRLSRTSKLLGLYFFADYEVEYYTSPYNHLFHLGLFYLIPGIFSGLN